jgi:hypothetical protein
MRRPIAIVIACLPLVLIAAGCGSKSDSTPTACLEGKQAYLTALEAAPGDVALAGGTPISSCLAQNQNAGDLAAVGLALVEAATALNGQARDEAGDDAGVRLGYLLGAAKRGADQTEGIHSDLVRRLTVAARFSPAGPLPAPFLAAYRRGFDAGRSRG